MKIRIPNVLVLYGLTACIKTYGKNSIEYLLFIKVHKFCFRRNKFSVEKYKVFIFTWYKSYSLTILIRLLSFFRPL